MSVSIPPPGDNEWRDVADTATTATATSATTTPSVGSENWHGYPGPPKSSSAPSDQPGAIATMLMKHYATGATRSHEKTFDPEGFLNPAVVAGYCAYMQKHRAQADGQLRDSDNWQKGMATSRALRSLQRHNLDAWLIGRGYAPVSGDCHSIEDALHGVMFNCMVILKNKIDGNDHEE